MTRSLSRAVADRVRFASQGLSSPPAGETVASVARRVCGLQAQDKTAMALSVRPRLPGSVAADVDRALYEDENVVRTWCMRGTLHLFAAEDVPWLLSLLGPRFTARGPESKRLAEMGLDEPTVERAVARIRTSLGDDGPLTLVELADRLRADGIDVDPRSQAPNFLVRQAALRGVLRETAPKDGANAYALLEVSERPAEDRTREAACERLARRYLAAFQPATLHDFVAWSGLLTRDAKPAWESLRETTTGVDVEGSPARLLDADALDGVEEREPVLRLLPAYDTSLLGYATENRPVPPEFRSQVWPGAGVVRPTIVADGAVVGTWRLDRSAKTPTVRVNPFEVLPDETALESEVRDVGRFLDIEPELVVGA
ncbi:winged helix DNA-binding domain-containing protein [Halogeometricum limi]|uniref:Winged helix DNA-binding domain-containing protein n=1 Tax=Halogeometricum limi TaxID=555875 RepID=A0A1I6G7E7_9EURY|nr:winged helix DNA-binding domain-containing protein [Halogeometricum limi]SFR38112.1 Winged helix DNA-binding domain-containing protein [Halogeometricum limi]